MLGLTSAFRSSVIIRRSSCSSSSLSLSSLSQINSINSSNNITSVFNRNKNSLSNTSKTSTIFRPIISPLSSNINHQSRSVSQLVSSILTQQREQDALKRQRRKELEGQKQVRKQIKKEQEDAGIVSSNNMSGAAALSQSTSTALSKHLKQYTNRAKSLIPIGFREICSDLYILGPVKYAVETKKHWSWYAFDYRKQKVYNVIWRITAGTIIFCTMYVLIEMVMVWNAAVHKNWQHYVRKERERSELMAIVKMARDEGSLPQSDDVMH